MARNKRLADNAKSAETAATLDVLYCRHCGTAFWDNPKRTGPDAMYCTDACKQAAWREKKKS